MANSNLQSAEVVVCGLATVDIVARPANLDQAVGPGRLVFLDRIEATTGGIVSNSGIALRRLGVPTAAIASIGRDVWGDLIRQRFESERIDSRGLIAHPSDPTSATIVLVDSHGQRSFLFCPGATLPLGFQHIAPLPLVFERARWVLFGYFSLFPDFDAALPALAQWARRAGCQTALDAAGHGGDASSLKLILPHLDLYVPSYDEAAHQTGHSDPREILRQFREWGANRIVGLKLGSRGALLSPSPEAMIEVPPVQPPGPLVDTTGAGDAFYAGLIAGLVRGMSLEQAGKIAAATGAASVTGLGASAGLLSWSETCRLAGVSDR